jgi:hypothetical protein
MDPDRATRAAAAGSHDVSPSTTACVVGDARRVQRAAGPVRRGGRSASGRASRPGAGGALQAGAAAAFHLRLTPPGGGWHAHAVPLMDSSRAREVLGLEPQRDMGAALLELLEGIRSSAGSPTPTLKPGATAIGPSSSPASVRAAGRQRVARQRRRCCADIAIRRPGLVGPRPRWWGLRLGGLVSAFPAIVGPLLLIAAHEHGTAFAAKAASGTLLGLVALSGFALAYGRTALHAGWRTSLAAGWVTAAAIAALLAAVDAGPLAGLAAATLSLVVAYCLLPSGAAALAGPSAPRWDLPLRMALTAALVVSLAAAATRLGPVVGGLLAALPVLASVLAVFTHEQQGRRRLRPPTRCSAE